MPTRDGEKRGAARNKVKPPPKRKPTAAQREATIFGAQALFVPQKLVKPPPKPKPSLVKPTRQEREAAARRTQNLRYQAALKAPISQQARLDSRQLETPAERKVREGTLRGPPPKNLYERTREAGSGIVADTARGLADLGRATWRGDVGRAGFGALGAVPDLAERVAHARWTLPGGSPAFGALGSYGATAERGGRLGVKVAEEGLVGHELTKAVKGKATSPWWLAADVAGLAMFPVARPVKAATAVARALVAAREGKPLVEAYRAAMEAPALTTQVYRASVRSPILKSAERDEAHAALRTAFPNEQAEDVTRLLRELDADIYEGVRQGAKGTPARKIEAKAAYVRIIEQLAGEGAAAEAAARAAPPASVSELGPWQDKVGSLHEITKADVIAGKVPGFKYDPDISPGVAAHMYDRENIVIGPGGFQGDGLDTLLMTHEIGHRVGQQIIKRGDLSKIPELQAWRREGQSFTRSAGYMPRYENPFGVSERPEEILADAYSELLHRGLPEPDPTEGERTKQVRALLELVQGAARQLGLPDRRIYRFTMEGSEQVGKPWVRAAASLERGTTTAGRAATLGADEGIAAQAEARAAAGGLPHTAAHSEPDTAARFDRALARSKAGEHGAFLSDASGQELLADGYRIFLGGPEDEIHYALSPEGDFGFFGSNLEKGAGAPSIRQAIEEGAKTADAFDGGLVRYYEKFGFREVARNRWDDEFAPPGWNYKRDGKPDVVHLAYRPDLPAEKTDRYLESWDDAKALSLAVAEREGTARTPNVVVDAVRQAATRDLDFNFARQPYLFNRLTGEFAIGQPNETHIELFRRDPLGVSDFRTLDQGSLNIVGDEIVFLHPPDVQVPSEAEAAMRAHVAREAAESAPAQTLRQRLLREETGTITPGAEPEEPAFMGQMRKYVRDSREARYEQKALRLEEVARKAGAADEAMRGLEGQEAILAARRALRGKLPQVEWNGMRDLDQETFEQMADHIARHPDLRVFEVVRAGEALTKMIRGQVPQPNEVKLLNRIFKKETVDSLVKERTNLQRLSRFGIQLYHLPRTLMSTLDLSFPLRQGIIPAVRHPRLWTRNMVRMHRHWGSEQFFEKSAQNIVERPSYPLMKGRVAFTEIGDDWAGREEAILSPLAEGKVAKKLLVGHAVRASSRAYTGVANELRADLMEVGIERLQRWLAARGETLDSYKDVDDALDSIALLVNSATGRGGAKHENTRVALKALNFLLFSPRLLKSRLDFINPLWYMSLHPVARRMALEQAGSFFGMAAFVCYLAKQAGAEVGLNPTDSDFLKIKIGDTRIDILGGFSQTGRLAATLIYQNAIALRDLRENDGKIEYEPFKNPMNTLLRFFRSKLAPFPSFITDTQMGKDYRGQPVDVVQAAYTRMMPILASDMLQMRQYGYPVQAFIPYPLAVYGVSVSTYEREQPEESEWSKPAEGETKWWKEEETDEEWWKTP